VIDPATLHRFGRERPGRREALGQGLLRLIGQQQAAQTASGIGQRGGDGVLAVEPDRTAWRVRRVLVRAWAATDVVAELAALAVVSPLVVLAGPPMERLALRPRPALIRLPFRPSFRSSLGPRQAQLSGTRGITPLLRAVSGRPLP
jgi:hypothetical protein